MSESSRRWWALIAIAACVLVVGLDLTVLNLALPTLARDLHASTGDLQWFASAYSLVVAAALLPAGMLGDWFGRKRVLLIALVLFGGASAACAAEGMAIASASAVKIIFISILLEFGSGSNSGGAWRRRRQFREIIGMGSIAERTRPVGGEIGKLVRPSRRDGERDAHGGAA